MKVIRARDLIAMPWKNGTGVTTEIAINPPGAKFSDLNFNWRISRAEIHGDGPFSVFPGYDRLLVVLGPDALLLNGVRREPHRPFLFTGEELIEARLDGPSGLTFDLGVIFRRGVRFEMNLVQLSSGTTSFVPAPDASAEICFYFCEGADVTVMGYRLEVGDAMLFSVAVGQYENFELTSIAGAIIAVFVGSTLSGS